MRKQCGLLAPIRRIVALLAVGVFALFVVGAPQARPSDVACGDTITQDTKLDHDLIGCPGDGLVIGADDIILDLGGHTIDGAAGASVGVDNSAGHDGVTIQRGTVREFGRGVQLYGADRNTVRRLAIAAATGVALVDGLADVAEGNTIAHSMISASAFGILLEAGPDNRVQENAVSGSTYGIYISGQAEGNRIERNSLSNNNLGILLSDSFGNTLVAANVVSENCAGIVLVDTHNARIERNRVFRSGGKCEYPVTGEGIAGDGIASLDSENVIEHNVANHNLDDGIDVEGGDIVARNTARKNGDLGIEATPEVIDGGGNHAARNGNQLQCLNVVCSR